MSSNNIRAEQIIASLFDQFAVWHNEITSISVGERNTHNDITPDVGMAFCLQLSIQNSGY